MSRGVEATMAVKGIEAGDGPRLRVAFIDHCAVLSGGELALARLIPALDVDAHVILGEDGPLRSRLEAAGATVHILNLADDVRTLNRYRVGSGAFLHAARAGLYAIRLSTLLRRLKPNLVHTNSLKAALYGGSAGKLAGVPVIWHVHDRISIDYMPAAAVRLVRAAARILPSAVIANSHVTLVALGAVKVPSVIIPSPVDVVDRRSGVTSRSRLRFGIVGRLAPWKGQDLFLRAFARAFPDGSVEAAVIGSALFGEDAYEEELKALASALGLEGRVEFRGFRSNVSAEFERLDVAVHCSTVPEPFGQVVVEAMMAGLAVVVADEGGPADLVENGQTGLTYRMGDEHALTEVLRRTAEDTELRSRLGIAAQRAAQRYRPEVIAPEVLAFYRRTLTQEIQIAEMRRR